MAWGRHIFRDQRGYSLVELAVVVAILAILVLIVIYTQTSSMHLAAQVSCQSSLRILRQALFAYYQNNGHYPDTLDALEDGYLQNRVPRCATTKEPYEYDQDVGRVSCPVHDN